jgi:hypothetical protein
MNVTELPRRLAGDALRLVLLPARIVLGGRGGAPAPPQRPSAEPEPAEKTRQAQALQDAVRPNAARAAEARELKEATERAKEEGQRWPSAGTSSSRTR